MQKMFLHIIRSTFRAAGNDKSKFRKIGVLISGYVLTSSFCVRHSTRL